MRSLSNKRSFRTINSPACRIITPSDLESLGTRLVCASSRYCGPANSHAEVSGGKTTEESLSLSLILLELFLSSLGLLHLEDVEPHRLAEGSALAHHHQVPQLNVPVCVCVCVRVCTYHMCVCVCVCV